MAAEREEEHKAFLRECYAAHARDAKRQIKREAELAAEREEEHKAAIERAMTAKWLAWRNRKWAAECKTERERISGLNN